MADPLSFSVARPDATLACVRFGSGPRKMVMLHPYAFSKGFFLAAAEHLPEGIECVCWDQRGHGATQVDPDEPSAFALDCYADDIAAVADQLGWGRFTLAGISLGAAASLRFASQNPERVEVLIQDLPAFGPSSARDHGRAGRAETALRAGELEIALDLLTAGLGRTPARVLRRTLGALWSEQRPAVLGPRLAAALRSSQAWTVLEPWQEGLARLAVRTEIFALKGDPLHPYAVAEMMARNLPDAVLHPRVQSLRAPAIVDAWLGALSRE